MDKKVTRKNNRLFPLAFAAALTIFIGSGAAFAIGLNEYQTAESEYAQLNKNITVVDATADDVVETAEVEAAEETQVAATEPVDDIVDIVDVEAEAAAEEMPEITYPEMDIDFGTLISVNPDVVGVIYIPALVLRYPVVQGTDNEFYLHHTIEGTKNSSGSIFLDYRAGKSMDDNNTFIYGHNMKNGTMFGSLKQFLYNEDLAKENPYIYLYLADGTVMKYHIFSYAVVSVNDNLYYSFDDAAYDEYVAQAQARSRFKGDQTDDFSKHPNLVTLSTCYGTQHTENFVVQAALEGTASMAE